MILIGDSIMTLVRCLAELRVDITLAVMPFALLGGWV
jgi:hypothetical protein